MTTGISNKTDFGIEDDYLDPGGWMKGADSLEMHGYVDPRRSYMDKQTQPGVPAWGDRERQALMARTAADRGRQSAAYDILAGQSRETPAAQQIGAYKVDQALGTGAGAVSAGGGDLAAQRAGMMGYGKKAEGVGGQTMAKAADERMRSISTTSQAADKALQGYTAVAGEGLQYQNLALQDKWNRMKALTDYEKQTMVMELKRSQARGEISSQELNFVLGMIGSGASAAASIASGVSGGISSSGSGDSAGYEDIDKIVDDVFG